MVPLQVLAFVAPLLTGFGTSAICPMGNSAGESVAFRPPSAVFGPAWVVLYILLGWSFARSLKETRSPSLNAFLYCSLIFLLSFWIVAYACMKRKHLALAILLMSLLACFSCTLLNNSTWTKLCLAPLFIWLIFALFLSTSELM